MAEVLLGLGSNLGDRRLELERALVQLGRRLELRRISSVYRTEPVGFRDQNWFFNAAATAETQMTPRALLALCAEIEHEHQRQRDLVNGPRTLDIDILLYGELRTEADGLTIPHPRMSGRRFVLAPAAEIAADMIHPVSGFTLGELLDRLEDPSAVEKLSLEDWPPPTAI